MLLAKCANKSKTDNTAPRKVSPVLGSFSERSQPLFINFNIDTQTQRDGLIVHLKKSEFVGINDGIRPASE